MTMPGLTLDLSAELCAAINGNTTALRESERRKQAMAAGVSSFRPPSFQVGTTLPAFAPDWGPAPGWSWAVQTMSVEGLGTSDQLNLYIGSSKASAVLGNGRFTFTVTAAGAISTYGPGRTGMVLSGKGQDSLAFSGSVAAAVTVNTEVIQVADAQLPYFLL